MNCSTVAKLVMAGLGTVLMAGAGNATDIGKLGGTWVLVRHAENGASSGQAPFFTISGRLISGFDGCNRFSGNLDQPGRIQATRRGCKEGYLKLPLDLNDAAAHLADGQIDGPRLRLPARAGLPASEFKRK